MSSKDILKLNIRGQYFELDRECCEKYPAAFLSKLDESHPCFNPEGRFFYLNRDPVVFNAVVNYYVTGCLHVPSSLCGQHVLHELEFWGFCMDDLADCCWSRISESQQLWRGVASLCKLQADGSDDLKVTASKLGSTSASRWQHLRRKIYSTMDDPNYSRIAMVYNMLMWLLIFFSIIILIVNTEPGVGRNLTIEELELEMISMNQTASTLLIWSRIERHEVAVIVEYSAIIVMTVDFIIKLIVCPSRSKLVSIYTVIDLLSLVPPYILVALNGIADALQSEAFYIPVAIVEALSVLRVFKLFNLARHIKELQLMVKALRSSAREIGLLLGIVGIMAIIYGSVIYYLELFHYSFVSIGRAVWWAVITMTTVGYGDYYPVGGAGCAFAALVALSGVVIMSMPIPIIVSNFNEYYNYDRLSSSLRLRERKANEKKSASAHGQTKVEVKDSDEASFTVAENITLENIE